MTREVRVPVCTVWSSPDAPRDVDEAAVRDEPDVAGWAASMGPDLRHGLHGRTETQLLLGEPVVVRDERDGWSEIVASWQRSTGRPDGYPGWVRSAHLGDAVRSNDGPSACVVTRTAPCSSDGGEQQELSVGTVLHVDAVEDQTVVVRLPDQRAGTVPLSSVRLAATDSNATVDDALAVAESFMGLRYLWGGTSTWGVDCSGLVHLSWRSQGVLLPRDAHEQADSPLVEDVPLDAVRPGDLYFFARPGERIYHVGFVTRPLSESGERWMLHAPEGGELVEDAPLAPHRAETLVAARRVRV
ncbi:MAG: NlpC/P60 family protein [Nocardioidaceae bacterium]